MSTNNFSHLSLVCAKNDELSVVQDILEKHPSFSKLIDIDDPLVQFFTFKCGNSIRKLRLSTCGAMGNMAAAIHVSQIIADSSPGVVFFLGTAASIDPTELQLGDVLIPRKAVKRIYDKISEKGQVDYTQKDKIQSPHPEKFFGDNILCVQNDTKETSSRMQTALTAAKYHEISLKQGTSAAIAIGDQKIKLRAPQIHHDKDIFSCDMVVNSISYRDFIKRKALEENRKLAAIDMESFGFYAAISAAKNESGYAGDGVMIRGISDYAGRKKETEELPQDWKSLSVSNAADVCLKIIEDLYMLEK